MKAPFFAVHVQNSQLKKSARICLNNSNFLKVWSFFGVFCNLAVEMATLGCFMCFSKN